MGSWSLIQDLATPVLYEPLIPTPHAYSTHTGSLTNIYIYIISIKIQTKSETTTYRANNNYCKWLNVYEHNSFGVSVGLKLHFFNSQLNLFRRGGYTHVTVCHQSWNSRIYYMLTQQVEHFNLYVIIPVYITLTHVQPPLVV